MVNALFHRRLLRIVCCSSLIIGSAVNSAAVADVFKLEALTNDFAAAASVIDPSRLHTKEPYYIVLNGAELKVTETRSNRDPQQIVSRVLNGREAKLASLAESVNQTGSSEFLKELSMPFAMRGENWASLIMVNFAEAAVSSRPDPQVSATFAMDQKNNGESIVWDIEGTSASDFIDAVLDDGNDAPGEDIPNVGRYPGSKRSFTLAILQDRISYLVSYQGTGQSIDRANYYEQRFKDIGLTTDHSSGKSINDRETLVYMSDSEREVSIFVSSNDRLEARDIIQIREK